MAGELLLVNPRKHRVSRKRKSSSRKRRIYARSNPRKRRRTTSRRRVTRARRNPISFGSFNPKSFIKDTLVPSGVGAAGAVALDFGIAALGVDVSGPFLGPAIRLGGAVGLGMLASSLGGKSFGENVMAGAVTVTLADMLKSTLLDFGIGGGNDAGNGVSYYAGTPALGYTGAAQSLGAYVGDTDEDDESYLDGIVDQESDYAYAD